MKIEQAHLDQIRLKFNNMSSKEDLVELLTFVDTILYGEKSQPVQLKALTYFANPDLSKQRYHSFTVKKKSGSDRTINAPAVGLKSILRSLNTVLQCISEPHHAATGFVPGKSIVDNAKLHLNQNYVYNIDLKDFFHSFDRNRVKLGLMRPPFNLREGKEPLAFLIACLCTHPIKIDDTEKIVLPQGSPTSPTLTNILCTTLDRRLNGLAKFHNAKYSRYADDITFSSPHNIYKNEGFITELKRIIEEDQKLTINENKTRLQKGQYRQETTGLTVNEKVNVTRRYVKQIRMYLFYWEKYGYHKANQIFRRDYTSDKGHSKDINANLSNVLKGKLDFMKMVKGTDDTTYSALAKRFTLLTEKNNSSNKLKSIDVDSILNVFAEKGLIEAMELYQKIK